MSLLAPLASVATFGTRRSAAAVAAAAKNGGRRLLLPTNQRQRQRLILSFSLFPSLTTENPLLSSPVSSSPPFITTRHFSAKNRKRKEERRKKRAAVTAEDEGASSSLPSTTTSTAATVVEKDDQSLVESAKAEPQRAATGPVVTVTKANATETPVQTPASTEQKEEEDGSTLIAARREDEDDDEEEEFVSQFDMPDRETETKLSQMQSQVAALYKQGNYKQALEIGQETLLATLDHFGMTHPATASSYVNVGLAYKQLGQFDLALEQYEKALQSYADTVGTDHASYAMVLHNMGMLYQSQIHLDDSAGLKQQDRLRYNELALDYLQQADAIRSVELPPEHPHVVATKSALGMTLTSHILHQHKRVSSSSYNNAKTGSNQNDNDTATTSDLMNNAASYVPTLPQEQQVTEKSWTAAEEHLQSAYSTALQNPRGESSLKRTDKNHYLNLQKKYNLKQKQKQKQKKQAEEKDDTPSITIPLQTASAASAAQNLAVFYKARSTTLEKNHSQYQELLQQAQDLYLAALDVRQALLPRGHPDIYITQYSLAELYEYTQQDELAQALRQTILDTYDPPTKNNKRGKGRDVLKPKQKQAGR